MFVLGTRQNNGGSLIVWTGSPKKLHFIQNSSLTGQSDLHVILRAFALPYAKDVCEIKGNIHPRLTNTVNNYFEEIRFLGRYSYGACLSCTQEMYCLTNSCILFSCRTSSSSLRKVEKYFQKLFDNLVHSMLTLCQAMQAIRRDQIYLLQQLVQLYLR